MALRGDAQARFELLFAQEYPGLARYCWSLTRSREAADDLAQEAFAILLRRWSVAVEPRAYLYRCATNLVRQGWRVEQRDRRRIEQLAERISETDATVAVHIRQAVRSLPQRLQDVVLLFYFADLSVAETAAAVGRPEGTVKRQLSDARSLLSLELERP